MFDRSVADNIAYGLRRRGLSLREISGKVSEALEWAGIGHLQMRNARDLSGGERQRTAVARALVTRPAVVLADVVHRDDVGMVEARHGLRLSPESLVPPLPQEL